MTELERQENDFQQIEANLREALEYEKQLNRQIMGKMDAYENIMKKTGGEVVISDLIQREKAIGCVWKPQVKPDAEIFNALKMAIQSEIEQLPTVTPEPGWISVEERLPPNASHPGAICPRYWVCSEYGTTEGWYNPDLGYWCVLLWFLTGSFKKEDIDMERGDIPKVGIKANVTHWMPLPEPPKEEKNHDV